jgi:hypothetical protein
MNLHLVSLEIDIPLGLLQFHGGSYQALRARAAHKAINYANRSFPANLIARRYLHCFFSALDTNQGTDKLTQLDSNEIVINLFHLSFFVYCSN